MYFLGIDVGTSSIKVSILNGDNGECVATNFYPKQEAEIITRQTGWAEQKPEKWWDSFRIAVKELALNFDMKKIDAIGISYQMHGLVVVDKNKNVLRPSIIWCDSRAVQYGDAAFAEIGEQKCFDSLLNSPGNFTAAKLKWVKENEPELFDKVYKMMLPGDYFNMMLTGEINTTISGLSEGTFWNFNKNEIADFLLNSFGFSKDIIPDIVPTFSNQGTVMETVANELGFRKDVIVSYRAGDQPNNAFSLNVINAGEFAATAGTSGVVYAVSDKVNHDEKSRVNVFAHVNHQVEKISLGILLCINGTGALNSWVKRNVGAKEISYPEMNALAQKVPVGSEGLSLLPFGNGAERILENKILGGAIGNLSFNNHNYSHIYRAAQEGIAFSFKYGMDILQKSFSTNPSVIRAGHANMFLSPLFAEALSTISGATIELYETDGSLGAARGAGVGAGAYTTIKDAFSNFKKISTIEPNTGLKEQYVEAYAKWSKFLGSELRAMGGEHQQ